MFKAIKTAVSVITLVTSLIVAITEMRKALEHCKRNKEIENDARKTLTLEPQP